MAQREIKFRIWDKMLGEMFDWQTVKKTSFEHYEKTEIETEPTLIFEQYTGLKDCEGIEIYEGDIVLDKDTYMIDEIKFSDSSWMLASTIDLLADYVSVVKIIGNIHENPELLEVE